MDGSDFHAPPPASSLIHLFAGARLQRTDARISLVTTRSRCQARHGLGPRGVPTPLARTQRGLLPAGGTSPSALSNAKLFGALHLQGRHHPLPLHLACFRAYASTRLLPPAPQGSILGSRLTITQAGLSPARTRGLARPHCPRIPRTSTPTSRSGATSRHGSRKRPPPTSRPSRRSSPPRSSGSKRCRNWSPGSFVIRTAGTSWTHSPEPDIACATVSNRYGDKARAVLDALLAKYADEGVLNLDGTNVLRIAPFSTIGTPIELIRAFGGKRGFEQAVHDLQSELYSDLASDLHRGYHLPRQSSGYRPGTPTARPPIPVHAAAVLPRERMGWNRRRYSRGESPVRRLNRRRKNEASS